MANEFNVYKGTDGSWTTAGNWTQGAPAAGDNLIISKDTTTAIIGGDQDADLLASLTVETGHAAAIGTTAIPLQVQATLANIFGTGSIHLTGTIATLNLANGTNTHLGYDNAGTNAAALTTVVVTSGSPRIVNSAITTCTVSGGTLTYGDPGRATTAITTLNLKGSGKCVYNSNATITAANLYGGTLDLSQETRAVTITTLTVYGSCTILDPNKRLTVTTLALSKGVTVSFS